MENQLKQINEKLDRIIALLETQGVQTQKMGEHIDFVEATYDTLRTPLNFVKNQVNAITGRGNGDELPSIRNDGE